VTPPRRGQHVRLRACYALSPALGCPTSAVERDLACQMVGSEPGHLDDVVAKLMFASCDAAEEAYVGAVDCRADLPVASDVETKQRGQSHLEPSLLLDFPDRR
jgi:hypothetical protein